jgi:hypothetical protein
MSPAPLGALQIPYQRKPDTCKLRSRKKTAKGILALIGAERQLVGVLPNNSTIKLTHDQCLLIHYQEELTDEEK